MPSTNRPTTTQRGYGMQHQRRRAALIPKAHGQPCPICGDLMLPGQDLDLDHTNPTDKQAGLPGDRVTHRYCNRARGNGQPRDTRTNGDLTSRHW